MCFSQCLFNFDGKVLDFGELACVFRFVFKVLEKWVLDFEIVS